MTLDNVESLHRFQDQERSPEYSDDALALDFAYKYQPDMRFVAKWSRWLIWDGARWVHDDTKANFDRARLTCRENAAKARSEFTDSKKALRVARDLVSARTVAAVERMAQADRRMAATVDQWDCNADVINTPDGLVCLHTGAVKPHDPDLYCTRITAVGPATAGARPTLWLQFLERVTDGNADLIAFLQRAAGYALTGDTTEHAMFFAYGTGRNGKGVFLNTISRIMGDYATVAPMEILTIGQGSQHPTGLAGLMGARLVTAQETEEGRRWAEARIKSLTGGDTITARFMRQDYFTFEPQFKLFVAGNHKPGLRGVDEAIRARLNLIPFTITIPKEERDPELPEKLKDEWPAIFRWAIEGCLEWRRTGLVAPSSVVEATNEYLADEDALQTWIDECTIKDTSQHESAGDLFNSWKMWAEKSGEWVGSQRQFTQTLESRGFKRNRQGKSRGFLGLRIIRTDIGDRTW